MKNLSQQEMASLDGGFIAGILHAFNYFFGEEDECNEDQSGGGSVCLLVL